MAIILAVISIKVWKVAALVHSPSKAPGPLAGSLQTQLEL